MKKNYLVNNLINNNKDDKRKIKQKNVCIKEKKKMK